MISVDRMPKVGVTNRPWTHVQSMRTYASVIAMCVRMASHKHDGTPWRLYRLLVIERVQACGVLVVDGVRRS